jgi:hypothetical protein
MQCWHVGKKASKKTGFAELFSFLKISSIFKGKFKNPIGLLEVCAMPVERFVKRINNTKDVKDFIKLIFSKITLSSPIFSI